MLTTIELCAGAGGQALGLEQAGFGHEALVEIEPDFCNTLRTNRTSWKVFNEDLNKFEGSGFKGVDLLAAGLPCPPFSLAGKQLGPRDERNLFPAMLRLVDEARPRAIMIENVRGFLSAVFEDYRNHLKVQLSQLGYTSEWRLLNASDFGVPQLRPRVVIVALRKELSDVFEWPEMNSHSPPTVGEVLGDLMGERGWMGMKQWVMRANEIAPTVVGGSKKHGGPDLGPTRAKKAWADLGVDGLGIADLPPDREFVGNPKLTVRMVARLQGFPDDWQFSGRKTSAYRQVGNAFPPPVARAVGLQLKKVLTARRLHRVSPLKVG